MPEESRKNQQKGRKDAKEQRKPRQGRGGGSQQDKKEERKAEEPKVPLKPVYEEPGPEFYQNLKRETDEILKITEEANSKYKKKEIQSNWARYEMPIESYDEMEELENMGADYEKLIEAPLSIGGHFQFKHEKTWNSDTGPSPYDKYFEINMDNLYLSISTVPFYERINVDKSMFSEIDLLTMNNRATRFKQKYFNDKTFTTPELKVQDKTLSSLAESKGKVKHMKEEELDTLKILDQNEHTSSNEALAKQIQGLAVNDLKSDDIIEPKVETVIESQADTIKLATESPTSKWPISNEPDNSILENQIVQTKDEVAKPDPEIPDLTDMLEEKHQLKQDPLKNPVIESPEDLEKWLDDFLDG